jgi:hypothetical protein
MMSTGNIYSEMNKGVAISVGTVKPYPVFDTTVGAAYAVGGLAAATTWIPGYFDTLPNGIALGGIYTDVTNGASVTNTGSAASPVFTVIS